MSVCVWGGGEGVAAASDITHAAQYMQVPSSNHLLQVLHQTAHTSRNTAPAAPAALP
jgi:hypothetical protein